MPDRGPSAVVSSTAAGALIGLLCVAVSIRVDVIAPATELRNRPAQTLILFGDVLFVGILMSIPHQPDGALGGELVTLALLNAGGFEVLGRRALSVTAPSRLSKVVASVDPNAVTLLLLLISRALAIADTASGASTPSSRRSLPLPAAGSRVPGCC